MSLSPYENNRFLSSIAVSPNQDRLKHLCSKLAGLGDGIEEEKQARKDAMDRSLQDLDVRITKSIVAHET